MLDSKWFNNHLNLILVTQDITDILKGVKTIKLPFFILNCISFLEHFALHIFFKITSYHQKSSNYLLNSFHLMIESLNLQKHEVFTTLIHRNAIFDI